MNGKVLRVLGAETTERCVNPRRTRERDAIANGFVLVCGFRFWQLEPLSLLIENRLRNTTD